MSRVLVTGGSGYVGTQLIAALLRDGLRVRATVRSPEREAGVREAMRRGHADQGDLEIVVADLTADEAWTAAAAGCEEVHHTASPMIQPKDPDELIVPARDGTLRVRVRPVMPALGGSCSPRRSRQSVTHRSPRLITPKLTGRTRTAQVCMPTHRKGDR